MKQVIDLYTDDELIYDDSVSDLVAVCQSYCINNNLGNWFYDLLHNNINFTESLPIIETEKTIACGDWCVVKRNKEA